MGQDIINYFQNDTGNYLQAIGDHLTISLLSLLAAIIIGLPYGVLASRNKVSYRWDTNASNTFRVVPSLAVLIFLIPIMGTGVKPALIALMFLAIPPS